jgi:hypothetical protein
MDTKWPALVVEQQASKPELQSKTQTETAVRKHNNVKTLAGVSFKLVERLM